MKTTVKSLGMVVLGIGLLAVGCGKKNSSNFSEWQSIKNPEVATQLKSFVAEKQAQANAATNAPPPEMKAFFAAAENGDWLAVSNVFADFRNHTVKYEQLRGTKWEAIFEIWGAFDAYAEGDEKYSAAYANDIINSIPPGSIYFGGTVAGRCLVTAMQKNQTAGDPFFTLSQNPLTDGTYLQYLRAMYGGKIYTPTDDDLQKSIRDYTADAQHRLSHDQKFPNEPRQLKPGEDVRLDSNGQIQLENQMNVIGVRELLTKTIFDKNTNQEFYVEESFPLDWMYPNLEPHGLIMKINRQPTELSDEIVQRDQDYWAKYISPMIGDWLNADTSVAEVAAFAQKVYVKKDLNGFSGDPQFVQNEYSCKMFSKLRSSIAGLYAWRAQHAADASEKKRMNDAADFAFRQAFALCPCSPEAVYRYVNLLLSEGRAADAILVAQTAADMPSMKGAAGEQVRSLVDQLKQFQRAK